MPQTNESAVRDLLERWAAAVRAKNMSEVLANHSPDFRMFDVPPPFESRGLAAYEDTWRLFYSNQPDPVAFDIKWLEVVAEILERSSLKSICFKKRINLATAKSSFGMKCRDWQDEDICGIIGMSFVISIFL